MVDPDAPEELERLDPEPAPTPAFGPRRDLGCGSSSHTTGSVRQTIAIAMIMEGKPAPFSLAAARRPLRDSRRSPQNEEI